MSDRIYADHHLYDNVVFSLIAPLTPASIRDQCIRATLLADRLHMDGTLNDRSRVLVIGGGVSGIMVATKILQLSDGAHVTILDQKPEVMSVQRQVSHRRVSPYQFDWPYHFSDKTKFPFQGPAVITWYEGCAADVAADFENSLTEAANRKFIISNTPQVERKMNSKIVRFEQDAGSWRVYLQGDGSPHSFDLIFLCCGASDENDDIVGYRGYRYWDGKDAFLAKGGLPFSLEVQRKAVLIVGGGDGALQDFIRLTTGEELPKPLLGKLKQHLDEELRSEIQALQAFIHRHFLLSSRDFGDSRVREFAAASFEKIADKVWNRPDVHRDVKRMLLPDRPIVQIACHNWWFGQTYSPNRLLVALLARALASDLHHFNDDLPPLMMGQEVASVRATPPRPSFYPNSADDWSVTSVSVSFRKKALGPPPVYLTTSAIPNMFETTTRAQRRTYRCILPRIGSKDEKNPVRKLIDDAWTYSTQKSPTTVVEVRQAIPQIPI